MNRFFLSIVSLLVSLSMSGQLPFQKSEVKEVMKKVADWQIAHQKDVKHGPLDWTNAALYMGMLDWAELAEKESGDTSYYDWLVKLGRRYGWQPDKRMYHADDIAVGQVFVDLYCKYKDRNMLYPTQARAEWVVNHPSDGPMELDYKKRETLERWTWCDALYMAPPVYVKLYVLTGDKRFIKFMIRSIRPLMIFCLIKTNACFIAIPVILPKRRPMVRKYSGGVATAGYLEDWRKCFRIFRRKTRTGNFMKICSLLFPNVRRSCRVPMVSGMPVCSIRHLTRHRKPVLPDSSYMHWLMG